MRIKLCAIAKDEAAYLFNWVFHHLYFGFDEVEVWLNNITDNSEELCREMAASDSRFKYRVADGVVAEAYRRRKTFQIVAYEKMYKTAVDEGFDYITFLDIDEFFVPKDFRSDVKSLISGIPNADVISLQWYFDKADKTRLPFDPDFKCSQDIYQNRHVKSILRIGKEPKVNLHNHIVKDGVYALHDGSSFEQIDAEEQADRSKVTKKYFQKNVGTVNSFFILHCMFRSETEYVASLLRGRAHVQDGRPLKINRAGYRNRTPAHSFCINAEALAAYNEFLIKELDKECISNSVKVGREAVFNRYHKVLSLIKDKPLDLAEFGTVFLGVSQPEVVQFLKNIKKRGAYRVADDRVPSKGMRLLRRCWLAIVRRWRLGCKGNKR